MMGCGGSRADAIIEPRYHESWTRDTESTWLTNTDVEAPLPVGNSKTFESGLREKRMVTTGTQCGKQTLPRTRTRRSISDQTGRDAKRKTSKDSAALAKDAQSVCSGDGEPAETCDDR
ncbi:brain and acute leukemia cytoplasmic protein [Corythoichthys intestinalis]|uniref:brain and acute leukemia cytoplasmic protein n=1 Tax=Corythoichthys intestinalis TaxID=161448 RepID=UPI0025A4F822|nr:brain and acute leukemia cytoplasmic protein [Corythoichthys intestinalis]XP_061808399.1 brain and acute leukemia cytoplasmic protein-like [Nerophis lumbriciformis]